MKSKFTYGILASILFLIGGLALYKAKVFWSDNSSELSALEAKIKTEELVSLAESAKYLENFYREPFEHELWGAFGDQCLKRYNLQESSAFRLACSSEILHCLENYLLQSKKPFYKKNEIQITLEQGEGKKIFEVVYPFEEISGGLAQKSHQLKLISARGESLKVSLLSNCQESFLDERFYAVGSEPSDKSLEIKFDTLNKKIMLDKFQVRVGEIFDWAIKTKKITPEKNYFTEKNAFKSFTRLPQKLMQEYCQDQGKQIMLSHFYDAASFIPFDLKNKEPENFPRGNYYWVKKNTDAWAHQYSIKSKEELLTEKNCALLYSKECVDKVVFDESELEPTWSGIYQVMGGSFEYLRNVLVVEENLRASSKYFSTKSENQRLGKRASWDGLGFQVKNFTFESEDKLPELDKGNQVEVSFRCYRESI